MSGSARSLHAAVHYAGEGTVGRRDRLQGSVPGQRRRSGTKPAPVRNFRRGAQAGFQPGRVSLRSALTGRSKAAPHRTYPGHYGVPWTPPLQPGMQAHERRSGRRKTGQPGVRVIGREQRRHDRPRAYQLADHALPFRPRVHRREHLQVVRTPVLPSLQSSSGPRRPEASTCRAPRASAAVKFPRPTVTR